MSYEPTTWKTGDVVTSTKLNKMEQGIADAGGGSGGGALIVNINTNTEIGVQTMDKTWQEIFDAPYCVMKAATNSEKYQSVLTSVTYQAATDGQGYSVTVISGSSSLAFIADSPDSYPTYDLN